MTTEKLTARQIADMRDEAAVEVVAKAIADAAAMDDRPRSVRVYQLHHNGACWEHIEGASWDMEVPVGATVGDALLQSGPGGEWPDDDDERVCFRVVDEDGEDMLDDDGDWRFVFTGRELRAGKLDD